MTRGRGGEVEGSGVQGEEELVREGRNVGRREVKDEVWKGGRVRSTWWR